MTEYENMTENDILETFFRERNSAENTQRVYHLYIRHYEEYTGHNLERLLQIAEDEETQTEETEEDEFDDLYNESNSGFKIKEQLKGFNGPYRRKPQIVNMKKEIIL